MPPPGVMQSQQVYHHPSGHTQQGYYQPAVYPQLPGYPRAPAYPNQGYPQQGYQQPSAYQHAYGQAFGFDPVLAAQYQMGMAQYGPQGTGPVQGAVPVRSSYDQYPGFVLQQQQQQAYPQGPPQPSVAWASRPPPPQPEVQHLQQSTAALALPTDGQAAAAVPQQPGPDETSRPPEPPPPTMIPEFKGLVLPGSKPRPAAPHARRKEDERQRSSEGKAKRTSMDKPTPAVDLEALHRAEQRERREKEAFICRDLLRAMTFDPAPSKITMDRMAMAAFAFSLGHEHPRFARSESARGFTADVEHFLQLGGIRFLLEGRASDEKTSAKPIPLKDAVQLVCEILVVCVRAGFVWWRVPVPEDPKARTHGHLLFAFHYPGADMLTSGHFDNLVADWKSMDPAYLESGQMLWHAVEAAKSKRGPKLSADVFLHLIPPQDQALDIDSFATLKALDSLHQLLRDDAGARAQLAQRARLSGNLATQSDGGSASAALEFIERNALVGPALPLALGIVERFMDRPVKVARKGVDKKEEDARAKILERLTARLKTLGGTEELGRVLRMLEKHGHLLVPALLSASYGDPALLSDLQRDLAKLEIDVPEAAAGKVSLSQLIALLADKDSDKEPAATKTAEDRIVSLLGEWVGNGADGASQFARLQVLLKLAAHVQAFADKAARPTGSGPVVGWKVDAVDTPVASGPVLNGVSSATPIPTSRLKSHFFDMEPFFLCCLLACLLACTHARTTHVPATRTFQVKTLEKKHRCRCHGASVTVPVPSSTSP